MKFNQMGKINSLTENINKKILSIIQSQINKIKDSKKVPLIVLSTGAYCPPHKVHIQNFILCKNQIKNYNLIMGLISPSHDNYIKSKNPYPWDLNGLLRLNLLNSIIKEEKQENFIIADTWEIEQNDFVDFPTVFDLRGNEIKQICKKNFNLNIEIGFLMGADLVLRTNCMAYMSQIGVLVIVSRPDWNNDKVFAMREHLPKNFKNKVIIVQPQENDFFDSMSSTQIRNFFDEKKFDKVIQFTSKDTVELLQEYFKNNKKKKTNF